MVAAVRQLEETNLTVEQIKNIGTALLSYLKENAKSKLAKEVFDSMPSLGERFGSRALIGPRLPRILSSKRPMAGQLSSKIHVCFWHYVSAPYGAEHVLL